MKQLRIFSAALLSLLYITHMACGDTPSEADDPIVLFSSSGRLGPIFASENAEEALSGASEKLKDYLREISGQEWDREVLSDGVEKNGIYVLLRTDPAAKDLWMGGNEPEGTDEAVARIQFQQTFSITIEANRVFLIGATAEAAEDAIYFFLSKYLGVNWFIPGDIGVEIPERIRMTLKAGHRIYSPSFLNRMLLHSKTLEGHKEWERYNLISRQSWRFNHNLHRLVTPDMMESNPDWFAWRRGKRVATTGGGDRVPNPNLVNPEVQAFIADRALDFFYEKPQEQTFSIATTDSLHYDESPATQDIIQPFSFFRNRPVYSDLVYGFSNAVAEKIWPTQMSDDVSQIRFDQVKPHAQDKFLGTLAYYLSEEVPSFPLHPRVIPYLTSDRAQWFSQNYKEEDKELIHRWSTSGAEIIGTWDYYEGWPYFIPRYFTTQVGESIPFLYEAGVRAFFAEGVPKWGFDAPRLWLAARLLWDAKQDPEALLETFFNGYYKEVADTMRQFFAICQQQWDQQAEPPVWIKYWMMPSQAELFPLSTWEALEDLLRTAEAQAHDEKVIARLALLRKELDLTVSLSRIYFAWKDAFHGKDGAEQRMQESINALTEVPVPDYARIDAMKKLLAETAERAPTQPSEGASVVFEESFTNRWLHGDTVGVGSLPFVSAHLDNGWRTGSFHNDTFRFTRSAYFAEDEGIGARILGSTYFMLSRSLLVSAGATVDARLRFRGKVSPGSRIVLSMGWFNDEGEWSPLRKSAEIPPGDYLEWRDLAEQAQTPEDARWLNLRVTFLQQMPGDSLEIDWIRVFEWEPIPAK